MNDHMKETERLAHAYADAKLVRYGMNSTNPLSADPEQAFSELIAHIQRGAPAPEEVPMPQGYVERPSDYTGDIWIESQMLAYGVACRAAGEAAGYARGLRDAVRDAERYSFLRGDGGPTSVRWPRWEVAHWTGNWNPVSGKELDAAVDAAMRGEVK